MLLLFCVRRNCKGVSVAPGVTARALAGAPDSKRKRTEIGVDLKADR